MLRTPIDFKEICSRHRLETAVKERSHVDQKQDSACPVKAHRAVVERMSLAFQTEISALEKDRARGYQTNIEKLLDLPGFVLTPRRKKTWLTLTIQNNPFARKQGAFKYGIFLYLLQKEVWRTVLHP